MKYEKSIHHKVFVKAKEYAIKACVGMHVVDEQGNRFKILDIIVNPFGSAILNIGSSVDEKLYPRCFLVASGAMDSEQTEIVTTRKQYRLEP